MYEIGRHVKLKPELKDEPWYTGRVLQIISYRNSRKNELVYAVNFEFIDNLGRRGDLVHPIYVYSDSECLILDRKLKLENLRGKIC